VLTVKDVAEKLKVHPQSVYRWIYAGKLEAIKIHGVLRIEEKAYERFIHKGREE
jgi:excisionase family DNA binding protein